MVGVDANVNTMVQTSSLVQIHNVVDVTVPNLVEPEARKDEVETG